MIQVVIPKVGTWYCLVNRIRFMNLDSLRLPYRQETAFGLLALSVFLVPLALSPYSNEGFESVKLALWMLCLAASLILYVFRAPHEVKYNKYFHGAFALFILWAVMAAFFSPDKLFAFLGFYYRYTSGVLFYSVLFLFMFLLSNFLDRGKLEFLLKIILVDAGIIALVSLLQGFGWIFYAGIETTGFFRGPSLLGNSNYSAMFMACALPFSVYLFYQAQSRSSKIYYLAVGFLTLFGVLLLSSRASLLGAVAGLAPALIFLLFYKLNNKTVYGLFMGAFVVLMLSFSTISAVRPSAIKSIFLSIDSNTYSRFYAWEVSLKGIASHPIIGNGIGNFASFFELNRAGIGSSVWGVFDDAHNIFLHLGVTGGLPLLFCFLALIILAGIYGIKRTYKDFDFLSLSLLCSLTIWLVSASFNPVPIPMYQFLIIILLGLILNSFKTISFKSFWLTKIAGLTLAILIFVIAGLSLVSEHMLRFSQAYFQNENYVTSYSLAKKAWAINPTNGQMLYYKAANILRSGLSMTYIEKDVEKLKNLHPNQAFTYSSISNLYSLAFYVSRDPKALDLAISYMEQALRIDSDHWERQGQLAIYFYQKGDLIKSKEAIIKQISLNPDDFSGWLLLAKLYQLENNKAAMLASLNHASKANPLVTQLKYIIEYTKQVKDIKDVPLDVAPRGPSF